VAHQLRADVVDIAALCMGRISILRVFTNSAVGVARQWLVNHCNVTYRISAHALAPVVKNVGPG
jgi:hypothetical protein